MENYKIACIKIATVNPTKADPYELAVTLIDGGVIRETIFYRFNVEDAKIELFGQTLPEGDLTTGDTFSEKWMEIKEVLEQQDYLVCFRSGDDFNSLDLTLKKRLLPYPAVKLFDAQNVSRRILPSLLDYQCSSISKALSLDLDLSITNISYVSAKILIACLELSNIQNIDELLDYCGIKPGRMSSGGYEKGSFLKKRKSVGEKDPKAKDISPEPGISPDPFNFFFEKNVLFTGTFKKWGFDKKNECQQIIANIGGFPQDGLNGFTNVLVEGVQNSTKKIDGTFTESDKQRKARERKEKGQDIEIISGDVFYEEAFEYIMMRQKNHRKNVFS